MSPLRTCDDLRPLLGGYVLDALEPDEAEAVREHLPSCAACSAEHASLAGLPALLDLAAPLAAPDEPLSPAFEEALLDRFARDRETGAAERRAAGGCRGSRGRGRASRSPARCSPRRSRSRRWPRSTTIRRSRRRRATTSCR